MTNDVLRELLDDLLRDVADYNEGIPLYTEGCPAQKRAIAKRDRAKLKADALSAVLREREVSHDK